MTNQEILDAIRASGKLETYSKEVMRDVLPQLSNREIYNALEWGVEQGQVIASQKSPVGNYVVKPLEVVAEVVSEPVAEEPVQAEAVEVSQEEDEAEMLFGQADVEWTASNGQRVRVWSGPTRDLYHVAVDAKLSCGVRFSVVPPQQAALARKAGVVCKLGPVGLNAERKLLCQRIDRSGLKSQPVG
jgi:hypothetical protein